MSQTLEFQQLRELEFLVGKNKVSLLEGNIIYVIAEGEQSLEVALAQRKANESLIRSIKGKVNYLIDLNKAGKNSPEARIIWKEISEEERTNKVATYGIHPVAKVIASFVMGITKKKDLRFFHTKQQALDWIHK